jgi:hypothetical protein
MLSLTSNTTGVFEASYNISRVDCKDNYYCNFWLDLQVTACYEGFLSVTQTTTNFYCVSSFSCALVSRVGSKLAATYIRDLVTDETPLFKDYLAMTLSQGLKAANGRAILADTPLEKGGVALSISLIPPTKDWAANGCVEVGFKESVTFFPLFVAELLLIFPIAACSVSYKGNNLGYKSFMAANLVPMALNTIVQGFLDLKKYWQGSLFSFEAKEKSVEAKEETVEPKTIARVSIEGGVEYEIIYDESDVQTASGNTSIVIPFCGEARGGNISFSLLLNTLYVQKWENDTYKVTNKEEEGSQQLVCPKESCFEKCPCSCEPITFDTKTNTTTSTIRLVVIGYPSDASLLIEGVASEGKVIEKRESIPIETSAYTEVGVPIMGKEATPIDVTVAYTE